MSDVTRVYLITGFLGSGKTTLLNRIIKRFPKDKKLTLLVNEFGEVGVDGTLVEGDDIDMMEISKGSIFCVCVKTDFIKGLYELNSTVKPDVLLIESTGVANPSDLKRDLKLPIFNDRFDFAEQFCVIDAEHFMVFELIERLFLGLIGAGSSHDCVQLFVKRLFRFDQRGFAIILEERQQVVVLAAQKVLPEKIAGAE